MNSVPVLVLLLLLLSVILLSSPSHGFRNSTASLDDSAVYLWPLPKDFRRGDRTVAIDPDLALRLEGPGGNSTVLEEAFERYKDLIFKPWARSVRRWSGVYDVSELTVFVSSDNTTVRAFCF